MTIKQLYRNLYIRYISYKDSPYFSMALYIVTLIIGLLLVYFLLIPQLQNFFSIREEIDRTRERITIMNNNIAMLNAMDHAELERDVTTATTAVPPERDVSKLLSAISQASERANVQLDDFSFNVGEVAVRDGASGIIRNEPQGSITFGVRGNADQVISLLSELHRIIPLLSITNIDARFGTSPVTQVTVSYYAKSLPTLREDEALPLKPLTEQNRMLLDDLASWDIPRGLFFESPVGSDSASPF